MKEKRKFLFHIFILKLVLLTDWCGKAHLILYYVHLTIFHISGKISYANCARYGTMAYSLAPEKRVANDYPAIYIIFSGRHGYLVKKAK